MLKWHVCITRFSKIGKIRLFFSMLLQRSGWLKKIVHGRWREEEWADDGIGSTPPFLVPFAILLFQVTSISSALQLDVAIRTEINISEFPLHLCGIIRVYLRELDPPTRIPALRISSRVLIAFLLGFAIVTRVLLRSALLFYSICFFESMYLFGNNYLNIDRLLELFR